MNLHIQFILKKSKLCVPSSSYVLNSANHLLCMAFLFPQKIHQILPSSVIKLRLSRWSVFIMYVFFLTIYQVNKTTVRRMGRSGQDVVIQLCIKSPPGFGNIAQAQQSRGPSIEDSESSKSEGIKTQEKPLITILKLWTWKRQGVKNRQKLSTPGVDAPQATY